MIPIGTRYFRKNITVHTFLEVVFLILTIVAGMGAIAEVWTFLNNYVFRFADVSNTIEVVSYFL